MVANRESLLPIIFQVTVRLFSNSSQMTSKCGKNNKSCKQRLGECVTDVLTTFFTPFVINAQINCQLHLNSFRELGANWHAPARGLLRKRCNRKLIVSLPNRWLPLISVLHIQGKLFDPVTQILLMWLFFRCPVTNRLCSKLRKQTSIMDIFLLISVPDTKTVHSCSFTVYLV